MNSLHTIILLTSLSLSFVLSYFAIKLLKKHSILDIPIERSSHRVAVPRGGGIAIMLTFIIMLFVCGLVSTEWNFTELIYAIFIAGFVSFVDDLKGLSPLTRSIFHIIAIIILMKALPVKVNLYWWIFFVVGLYAFMNFYNFMDGIDGSATVGAIHIGFSTFIIALIDKKGFIPKEVSIIALIMVGASCSFLLFNWSPAKMFLGDVGSITLGLVCGWLMINLFLCGYMSSAVIIPLYYMADSSITILIRLFNGKKIWLPHSEHFFQKAVKKGYPHSFITGQIIIINSILFGIALLGTYYGVSALVIAVPCVLAFLYRMQTAR